MGKEMDAEWYDNEYKNSPYNNDLAKCGYLNLYCEAMYFLPDEKNTPIIDLGCGTGRFAKLLEINGFKNYVGLDFSITAIHIASEYCQSFSFGCYDLKEISQISKFVNEFEYIFLLEVLEHIDDDMKLLNSINQGKNVVFSVPPSNYKSHVRFFNTIDDVYKRYDHVFEFKEEMIVKNHIKPNKQGSFLFNAIKK